MVFSVALWNRTITFTYVGKLKTMNGLATQFHYCCGERWEPFNTEASKHAVKHTSFELVHTYTVIGLGWGGGAGYCNTNRNVLG